MQSILAFIIIVIALATFSYFGQPPKPEGEAMPQPQNTLSQDQVSASAKTQTFLRPTRPATKSPESKPTIWVNTYIVSGPEEGEVIDKTNKVTFEFEAKISPEETEGRVSFETKFEGFDDNWVSTYSKKRTAKLPSGPKEYTFLVRAKIKDSIDPTPAKRTFKINVSPYFEKVKISRVNVKTSSRHSLITLRNYLTKEEEINITNWSIKGKGGKIIIPQGIEKYYPFYSSFSGEDIFVKRGDTVYLSSAFNPLGRGRNFRPNKCLGYLANYHNFPLSFPKNCPKPKREEISHLDPCCQEFILKMGRCEIPDYSQNRVALDPECISYLNDNFNYGSCFRNYSRDEDFLEKSWHIYLNRNIVVSNDCDTLYLRDQNGLIVDKYSYGRPICR